MAERLTQVPRSSLLEQALRNKTTKEAEEARAKTVQERVPELEKKALILLGLEEPEIDSQVEGAVRFTPESFAKRSEEIAAGLAWMVSGRFESVSAQFEVPIEGSSVAVSISRRGESRKVVNIYEDRGLMIDVHNLDYILRINNGRGVVESKARDNRHTHMPMLAYDSSPIWTRQMNMEDFENYNNLLDRLSEPDVIRVDNQ